MGCSSGVLKVQGEFEPTGVPLHYILAGWYSCLLCKTNIIFSPAIVGNLWDVTERDLNKLTDTLLQTWLGDSSGKTSLAAALPQARRECTLKYLNGAAAICYGVPIMRRLKSKPLSKGKR